MKIRRSFMDRTADVFIYTVLVFICLLTVYPMIYVASMSLSGPEAILKQEVWLFPIGFSLDSYRMIFETPLFWTSYLNTLWYTIIGTLINLLVTIPAAFVLSSNTFFARKFFMIMFTFTMFFTGTLIPVFIQVNKLGLYDTRWAIVLPVAVNTWNLIIARTFFKTTIPGAILESAKMDGANDITILLKVVLPISKALIAVLTIFYAVAHWNSWFTATLYLTRNELHPLQLYLRRILLTVQSAFIEPDMSLNMIAVLQQIKFSSIVVATLPILFVYPFFQKYFVQGVMLGSIKE